MSDSSDNDDDCETFTSTKGGLKLFKNGFTYEKANSVKEISYWYCEIRKNKLYSCRASVNTSLKEGIYKVIKINEDHNHGPDPSRKSTSQLIEKMKKDVSSGMKICKVIQSNKANAPLNVAENLPSTSALKQNMYRYKKKEELIPEPKDIFFEPNELHTSINGVNFIIKDQIFDEKKRILIMSTLELMTVLSKSSYWILDGTFKIVPSVFKQLYAIHGNILSDDKKTFPLCFCLCTNKDKRTYDIMFELIIQYGQENNIDIMPKVCVIDFEKAAISSIKSCFENVLLQGCLFHLSQIIIRQIQALRLTKRYNSDITFNKQVKCLLALAFLPEAEIAVYFNKLLEYIDDPDWKRLAQWFEENYVSGTWSSQPKYSPNFWSCHSVDKMKIPRTSNSAEAWHRRINTLIERVHPGVYRLIKELIDESLSNICDIECKMLGAPPQQKKRKYLDKDDRIDRILSLKSEYSEVKLLMCIAKNLNV